MERFVIISESGVPVGSATREECHSGTFLLHGVVHALVFTGDGRLILQKRSLNKDIQPGKWDTSIGGHISFMETQDEALRREAAEELGIQGISFEKLYSYIMQSDIEREFVTTYRCIWESPVVFDTNEIEEVGYFTEKDIHSYLGTGFFTPNFEEEWELYRRWCSTGHI